MQTFRLEMCNLIFMLAVGVASLSHNQSECDSWTDVFVKPENALDCGGEHPCHSLSEYISSLQCYFTSNTTIHFLPGTYLLKENITVRGVRNLAFVGSSMNSSQGPSATIQCSRANVGLVFVGGTNLSVRKITIRYCGRLMPRFLFEMYKYRYQVQVGEEIRIFTALLVANINTLTI